MGAPETQATETIGRYEIAGRLASGGMAEILLGRLIGPSGFERPVVIKRILPHLAEHQNFVSMFLDEARLAAQIRHPNVVQVHELGQEGDDLYLVMEYLEGENAAGVIRRSMVAGKEPDYALCAFVMAEACAGLHSAHELKDSDGNSLNLVHRDISPQNIFVTYDGAVKVLDFGIAKAADRITQTEAGQLKGKFEYMSPEQCRGKAIDRRSDVFALGIVLYELSTRKRLFKRNNKLAVLEAVCREPIIAPSKVLEGYPEPLERVLMKALSRDLNERYASAAEMRRDLLGVMRQLDAPVAPEESLAALMHEIFPDRMSAKNDMLKRVREGVRLTEVPSAEADSNVEIPEIAPGGTGWTNPPPSGFSNVESGFSFGSVSGGTDAYAIEYARARRRRAMIVGGAAVGALAVIALAVGLRDSEPDPVPLNALGRQPAFASFVYLAKPKAAPTVVLDIGSTPSGARVLIDGKDKGTTPLEIALTKSSEQVELRLKHEGFADASEKLTPDMNQRVQVSLSRVGAEEKKKPSRVYVVTPKPKPTGGGFHRFD